VAYNALPHSLKIRVHTFLFSFAICCFVKYAKMCYRKNYYQEGNHVYRDAYRRALNTWAKCFSKKKNWAKWVDSNIDPKKTTGFFTGYSASHFRYAELYL
jgi:hypothetical protein